MLDEMGFGPLEEKEATTGAVLSRIATDLSIFACGFLLNGKQCQVLKIEYKRFDQSLLSE